MTMNEYFDYLDALNESVELELDILDEANTVTFSNGKTVDMTEMRKEDARKLKENEEARKKDPSIPVYHSMFPSARQVAAADKVASIRSGDFDPKYFKKTGIKEYKKNYEELASKSRDEIANEMNVLRANGKKDEANKLAEDYRKAREMGMAVNAANDYFADEKKKKADKKLAKSNPALEPGKTQAQIDTERLKAATGFKKVALTVWNFIKMVCRVIGNAIASAVRYLGNNAHFSHDVSVPEYILKGPKVDMSALNAVSSAAKKEIVDSLDANLDNIRNLSKSLNKLRSGSKEITFKRNSVVPVGKITKAYDAWALILNKLNEDVVKGYLNQKKKITDKKTKEVIEVGNNSEAANLLRSIQSIAKDAYASCRSLLGAAGARMDENGNITSFETYRGVSKDDNAKRFDDYNNKVKYDANGAMKNESVSIAELRARLLIEAADALGASDSSLPSVDDDDYENDFYGEEEPDVDDDYMPEVNGAEDDDDDDEPEMEEIEDLLEDDDDAIDLLTDDEGMEIIDAEPTVESILRFNF